MSGTMQARVRTEHIDDVLTITRLFDAPRELVFDAWTKAEHFAQWFGPTGAIMPHCSIALRDGGELHFFLREPGDAEVWCKGVFGEVRRPQRLAITWYFSDAQGNHVERPGFPWQTVVTANFLEQDGKTKMLLRQEGLVVDQGEAQGWKQGFERLDALLAQFSSNHS